MHYYVRNMKKIVSALAIASLLGASLPGALSQELSNTEAGVEDQLFTDIDRTHPNFVAIRFLKEQQVIGGYEDGSFRPNQKVNRAEALKFILVGSRIQLPESTNATEFPDVPEGAWFKNYVMHAKSMGIVGGNPDGTFAPGNTVMRAAFLKMLLMANRFKPDQWVPPTAYTDVSINDWFHPYVTYAGYVGLIRADESGNLRPGQELTRAQVAEIIYLMTMIRNSGNLFLLMRETEQQVLQVEYYINAGMLSNAKRATELAVDYTQQAYKLAPEDAVVIGLAKIAKAYDFVLTAFIAGVQDNFDLAKDYALQATAKAQEAIDTDEQTRPIAEYIQRRAQEVLQQLNGQ